MQTQTDRYCPAGLAGQGPPTPGAHGSPASLLRLAASPSDAHWQMGQQGRVAQ